MTFDIVWLCLEWNNKLLIFTVNIHCCIGIVGHPYLPDIVVRGAERDRLRNMVRERLGERKSEQLL
jgi:hypothetical protein